MAFIRRTILRNSSLSYKDSAQKNKNHGDRGRANADLLFKHTPKAMKERGRKILMPVMGHGHHYQIAHLAIFS